GWPFTIKANNVIIRYMTFRPGSDNVAFHEGDGLGAMDRENLIIDHCSVSWSVDECLSVYGSKNFTVQWCTSTQSLVNSGHSKGAHGYGGNWGGSGASYHHNLIAHHTSRTPRLGPRPSTQTDERMDFRNCVIYNYGKNGCYGGEGMKVNIVNNYYKPGPASATDKYGRRIAGINIRTSEYTAHDTATPNDWDKMWHVWGKFFVDGNVNSKYADVTKDNWTYGIYNQIDNSKNDNTYTQTTKDTIKLSSPLPFVYVTTHTAEKAYEKVLNYVGNSLYRDKYDQLIINDVLNGLAATGSGKSGAGFIDTQYDIKYLADTDHDSHFYPVIPQEAEAKTDTDGDGMPDEWETANGLNPNDANDGKLTNAEGYTNLEVYLNSLVAHITEAQNAEGQVLGYETAEEAQNATSIWQPIHILPTPNLPFLYNLSGQQVDNNYHGIVIRNNKKYARY
ncbi:MAG: pectate lyase, partial [Prevotella sp.]|nr:pectate lyase [Prevotella sp.]